MRPLSKSFVSFKCNPYLRSPLRALVTKLRKKSSIIDETNIMTKNLKNTDPYTSESVKLEKEKVIRSQKKQDETSSLQVLGLEKVYYTSNFCAIKKSKHAVKELYLQANRGELLGLLGHNGAGKI